MAKPIIVQPNDTLMDIISAIEKVYSSRSKSLSIYIPDKLYLLYNISNVTLLSEVLTEARQKKEVIVFSKDKYLEKIFQSQGIEVVTDEESLAQNMEHLGAPASTQSPFYDFFSYEDTPNDFDTIESPIAEDISSTLSNSSVSVKSDIEETDIERSQSTEFSIVGIADPVEKNTHKHPKRSKREKRSNKLTRSFPWNTAILGLGICMGVAFLGIVIFVPKARIVLQLSQTEYTKDLGIIFRTDIDQVGQLTVPANIVTRTTKVENTFSATGFSENSTKAEGEVLLINKTNTNQPLVKDTRFRTKDGLQYRLKSSVTIPSNGEVRAVIVGDEPGSRYNITEGILTIPGLESTPTKYENIYGEVTTAITNGANSSTALVSQDDIDKAKLALRDLLISSVESIQIGDENNGGIIIQGSINDIVFSGIPAINTNTESFTAIAEANLQVLEYSKQDLDTVIEPILQSQIVDNKVLSKNYAIAFDTPQQQNDKEYLVKTYVNYFLEDMIQTNQLKKSILFRSPTVARDRLESEESVISADITLQPAFLTVLPLWSRNISITSK